MQRVLDVIIPAQVEKTIATRVITEHVSCYLKAPFNYGGGFVQDKNCAQVFKVPDTCSQRGKLCN